MRWQFLMAALFALVLLHVVSGHGTSVLGTHDGSVGHVAVAADGGHEVNATVKAPLAPPHPAQQHSSCDMSVARTAVIPAMELTELPAENRSVPPAIAGPLTGSALNRPGWAIAAELCVLRV